MSDPRFDLLGKPCPVCRGRGGVHGGECPSEPAPRPAGQDTGRRQTAADAMTGQRRENIARALWEAERIPSTVAQPQERLDRLWTANPRREHYRRLADAAIAADDLPARVEALAEELQTEANDDLDRYRNNPHDVPILRDIRAAAEARLGVADRLRALLDGPDTGRRS